MDPAPIGRLRSIESAALIAHEAIFDLHRRLIARDVARPSIELLAESGRIVLSELPRALDEAQELRARWSEQSVLDPEAAQGTLHQLGAAVKRAEPEALALLKRQSEIARELRSLLEAASG